MNFSRCLSVLLVFASAALLTKAAEKIAPNLVYILVDDMGYGDVSALNPDSKIQTPHIDRLADEGMIFTDAHSSSSVCTPTRYNILTGRYNWRTRMKRSVLDGYGPPLIEDGRLTLAHLYQNKGYATAMIGKWHLGMDLPFVPGGEEKEIDWSQPIGRTPTSNGFDYFWGHGASLDFPPYVYIVNEHYTSTHVVPTEKGINRPDYGFMREGPIADNFDPMLTLDEFCSRAAEYILESDPATPFCLYVPLTSPHTPIYPTKPWQGSSNLSAYGDFCVQTDNGVGRILDALDRKGIADNTIVIFTADNGCSRRADFADLAAKGHFPSYIYRGSKSDIWEGAHRVPHLLRWPAQVAGGSETHRITLLGDIFATMAEILDYPVPDDAGEDSMSFLAALRGVELANDRDHVVNHSVSGQFAIRQGDWKLLFSPGSGGWTSPTDKEAREMGLPDYQLYNLAEDPGETTNLIAQHPEIERELTELMTSIVVRGRSTPGPDQKNFEDRNQWDQTVWMQPE